MGDGDARARSAELRCGSCYVILRSGSQFCHRCGSATGDQTASSPARPRRSSFPSIRNLDRDLKQVALLFGLLLLIWGGASLVQPPTLTFDLAVTALGCALILFFCNEDRRAIFPMLRWRAWPPGAWRRTILAALVLFPSLAAYFWFAEHLGFPVPSLQEQQPHLPMWLIVVLACVVAPIFEELCFRGYILGKLARALGSTDALIIQAALFSVLHLAPVSFVSHFLIGLALGYLARTTKSLYPPIALHATWNTLVILSEL